MGANEPTKTPDDRGPAMGARAAAAADSSEPAIRIRNLACGYEGKVVVEAPSLDFGRGRITCVLGPSGCGKSTLLRTMLRLEDPIRGSIEVDGVDVARDDARAVEGFRRKAGVLFQGAALFNSLSLLENTAFPLMELGRMSRPLAHGIAMQKLALTGLAEFSESLPARVSGGMRKRAGIARAIATDPAYLFLDEPSSGLDPVTAAQIDDLVLSIRDRFGTTIVVITHELASLHTIADDLIMLAEGRVIAAGPRKDVEANQDPIIRNFFERRGRLAPAGGGAFERRLDAAEGPA